MASNKLNEKCGVFGIYNPGSEAARLTHTAIFALQHRGQESSGIVTSNGSQLYSHIGMGLVARVYEERDIDKLKGHIGIGHNRYATSERSCLEHAQPVIKSDRIVALGHNGNLPLSEKMDQFLQDKGLPALNSNDSEKMTEVISFYLRRGASLEEAITDAYPLFTGAFSLVVITADKLAAVRDSRGIRPLTYGRINGGHLFSSETCAVNAIHAESVRDVKPGEMIVIDKNKATSYQLETGQQKLDIFEFVYFARPDSILLGKSVYGVRKKFGEQLAKECRINADIVVPIPDSAIPAAIGFSQATGFRFEEALTKNRYILRTFIEPDARLRERNVETKLNPIPEIIKGQRVALVDDSIVRGTTIGKLVKIFRDAGAREVHVLIPSPPIRYPDFYGIDTPKQTNLIAANYSTAQIREMINADSLHYLSYEGMIKATGLPENVFSTSCFTGVYPIDIGRREKEVLRN